MKPSAARRVRHLSGPLLLALGLTAAACSNGDAPSGSPVSDAATDAPTTSVAEPSPSTTCPDTLPDVEMACGRLEVPTNHDEPNGDTFSLRYVVLPALGADPVAEPLVFIQGGPGFSTLETMPFFIANTELRTDRDMIFLEQRGTDPSGLFLRCQSGLATLDDVRECHDGYVADGVDLSAFTTLNAARDLATLRAELGIDRWHLLGGSYGTTLAMVLMDNDSGGTASVILDAPTAPDVVIYNADVESLLNAYSKVFANCAADADCDRRNPNLFDTHLANFDRLFEEPWDVTGTDLEGEFGPAIDTEVYLAVAGTLISGQPGGLPAFVTAVAGRDADALATLVEPDDGDTFKVDASGPSEFAIGLNCSIYCAEEAPFFDLDGAVETVNEWPVGTVEFLLPPFEEICEIWDVEPADPDDVDQVQSAIPTLILAGEYDHTTPLRQGEIAAAGLSDVELIDVPSTGHTTIDNACARSIMADFLRGPGGDRSCLLDIAPIEWQ